MIAELNQTGRSVQELAKEDGLSEVAELRKEKARLKEELELLKKAAVLFSRKT